MQLVIDANVVMAMLIKPGKPIDLLLRENLEIFAPELLLKEIENNKRIIKEKTGLNEEEINQTFSIIREIIQILPEEEFTNHRSVAEKICPDSKDIDYFALALHLNCPIWTNEKRLKEQSAIKIYSTHELIELFRN